MYVFEINHNHLAQTISDQVSVAGSAAAAAVVVVVSHIEGECSMKLYLQSDHHYPDTTYSHVCELKLPLNETEQEAIRC